MHVSLDSRAEFVVSAQGKILKEGDVASEPHMFGELFETLRFVVKRIGLEAGRLSQWLHAVPGFETVLPETRRAKAASSPTTVKTHRKDAGRIAQLIRMGWFPSVRARSIGLKRLARRWNRASSCRATLQMNP